MKNEIPFINKRQLKHVDINNIETFSCSGKTQCDNVDVAKILREE
jgi:hypothetical protein